MLAINDGLLDWKPELVPGEGAYAGRSKRFGL